MDRTIVAADVGYGSNKAMIAGKKPIHFPSGVSPTDKVLHRMNGERRHNADPIKYNGVSWVAGIEQGETTYERHKAGHFAKSPDYHVLVLETLDRLSPNNSKTWTVDTLVLGLPSKEFEYGIKTFLKETFVGDHNVRGRTITVRDVKIADQPVGTAAAYLTDNADRLKFSKILIVDIGYGTTDIACIVRGGVDRSLSSSLDTAMKSLCALVAEEIGGSVSAELIDEVLRSGSDYAFGDASVNSIVKKHVPAFAAKVVDGIRGKVGSLDAYEEVVITGGGRIKAGDDIAKLITETDVVLMDNPVTANIRGYVALAEGSNE